MTKERRKETKRFTLALAICYKERYDACTGCGKAFSDRDTQHLGFDKSGNCMNVCDSCEPSLEEVACRYAYVPRLYTIPEPEDTLWRYMDFAKFVSLLKERALYFPAAVLFKDPFEGAIGDKSREEEWDKVQLESFQKIADKSSSDKKHYYPKTMIAAFKSFGEHTRKCTFINSWHLNEHESEAMWSLYTKDQACSIAIKTTYDRLYNAIGKNPLIDIGKVNYIDYTETFVEIRAPFWFKRKSFQHENEVRAILTDYDKKEFNGLYVQADLNTLIQTVCISPTCDSWLSELIDNISQRYGVSVPITKSAISSQPFY
ncbi:hypothetical protein ACFL6N_05790 [Thermodesulfobacteriota bacterium]